mgnify:CR=1 FL=1
MNGPGSHDDPTSIAIGHLTRGVAHDFSNALTSILSSAELLAEATDADDPRRSDIERIRRASLKARTGTMQLSDFTKAKAEVASRFSEVERIESRRQLREHVLERDCELGFEGDPAVQFFGDAHAFDRAMLHWVMDWLATPSSVRPFSIRVGLGAQGELLLEEAPTADESTFGDTGSDAWVEVSSTDLSRFGAQMAAFAQEHGGQLLQRREGERSALRFVFPAQV